MCACNLLGSVRLLPAIPPPWPPGYPYQTWSRKLALGTRNTAISSVCDWTWNCIKYRFSPVLKLHIFPLPFHTFFKYYLYGVKTVFTYTPMVCIFKWFFCICICIWRPRSRTGHEPGQLGRQYIYSQWTPDMSRPDPFVTNASSSCWNILGQILVCDNVW